MGWIRLVGWEGRGAELSRFCFVLQLCPVVDIVVNLVNIQLLGTLNGVFLVEDGCCFSVFPALLQWEVPFPTVVLKCIREDAHP